MAKIPNILYHTLAIPAREGDHWPIFFEVNTIEDYVINSITLLGASYKGFRSIHTLLVVLRVRLTKLAMILEIMGRFIA